MVVFCIIGASPGGSEKNTLEGVSSRSDDTEKRVGDLRDRLVEITQEQKKKFKK